MRWQGYSREQRSTVNFLFLTYAAALLGLQSSILLSKEVTRVDGAWLFIAAGGGALLSLTAGCVVLLVRLRGARLTARIARFRVEQKSLSDIDALRRSMDKLEAGRFAGGRARLSARCQSSGIISGDQLSVEGSRVERAVTYGMRWKAARPDARWGHVSGRGARDYSTAGRARVARKFSPPVVNLNGSSLTTPGV